MKKKSKLNLNNDCDICGFFTLIFWLVSLEVTPFLLIAVYRIIYENN